MKYFIKIICFILVTLFLSSVTFASSKDLTEEIQWVFVKINNSVVEKNPQDKWLKYYKNIVKKLDLITDKIELNEKNAKIIWGLMTLINNKIFELEDFNRIMKNKIILDINNNFNNYKKIYDSNWISNENGIYYWYIYDEVLFFKSWQITVKSLEYNWITPKNSIIILKDGRTNFVKNYTKIKLATEDQLYWVPWKYDILLFLKNNKVKFLKENYKTLTKIKEKTFEITKNIRNKEEKISIIYDYVLNNIEYPSSFDLSDYKIYDWLETFVSKSWVCEWYVEIFKLMLAFIDIEVETINWDVLNAKDFPKIWHAWSKIGDYYYDTTFDDPVWTTKNRTSAEYEYYKIPEDLFYTNRYNYWKLPTAYKSFTLEQREELIYNNLVKIYEKYKNSNYLILKKIAFRDKYNLSGNKLSIVDFQKTITSANVSKDFSVKINWKEKSIKTLKYITVTDDNIEFVIEKNFDYSIENLYLFNWELENWKKEMRLSSEVVFY